MNRLLKITLPAFLLGAGVGALDVALLMVREDGIRLLSPFVEILQVLLYYGAFCALVGVILGLILRKWQPLSIANLAASLCLFGVSYIWVHSRILTNQPMFEFWSVLASLGVVAGCLAFAGLVRLGAKTKWGKPGLLLYIVLPSILPLTRQVHLDTELRPVTKPDQPNVTILVLDTLRADRLSCYGYTRPDGKQTSPVLDDLASQGALFEWSYAAAPWTRPSVASLFSGLYPASHGAYLPTRSLPEWTANIAEMFQGMGYRTAGFSANANISAVWGFAQGFEEFWCLDDKELIDMSIWGEVNNKLHRYLNLFRETSDTAEIVNARVFPWIDRMDQSDRPVFTYVQYLDPHFPYNPVVDIINDDQPDFDELSSHLIVKAKAPQPFPFGRWENPGPRVVDGLRALYDAEIAYLDREIGVTIEKLRGAGLLGENDWLIITSDHGEEFFEHEQLGHGQNLYQEVIRVPLLVLGPGIPKGKVIQTPVSLIDMLPTLAQIVDNEPFLLKGAKQKTESGLIPSNLPGKSLLALLTADEPEDLRRIYSEKLRLPENLAVRIGDTKLVRTDYTEEGKKHDGTKFETFFDLAAHPQELRGYLATDMEDFPIPEYLADRYLPLPDGLDQALVELRDAMGQLHQQALRLQQSVESKPLSPSERERLIIMGYLTADEAALENPSSGSK
jgi:arylsulfatase A-like enzyme